MKILILYIITFVVVVAVPGVFAQTASNADFNPFAQVEQDFNNSHEDATTAPAQEQNDDAWPPVNSNAQNDSEVR